MKIELQNIFSKFVFCISRIQAALKRTNKAWISRAHSRQEAGRKKTYRFENGKKEDAEKQKSI